jgi:hypothetical protein
LKEQFAHIAAMKTFSENINPPDRRNIEFQFTEHEWAWGKKSACRCHFSAVSLAERPAGRQCVPVTSLERINKTLANQRRERDE